jgi:hypothetical protein
MEVLDGVPVRVGSSVPCEIGVPDVPNALAIRVHDSRDVAHRYLRSAEHRG